ncbi:MAG: UDP-2,3-diacylglucosamine diphosphatase [Gammaproteobacteria bacterium]|nr:UDP-2,3-diacylglucosamine diphosphatase [Gammaproteobacteria bacterium]
MAQLFVSDLHLDAGAPEATQQFLGFLRREARDADALYILGDLFESWIGDDDPEPGRERICAGLRELTRAVPCFVLSGNRDFLLGAGFAARSGARLLPDPVVADLDGTAVLLSHGDTLCTGDHGYQALRSIVRSPRWQARFLALGLEARALLADQARAGSRAHTARVVPQIMDVAPEAVLAALRATGTRWLIHGHTHRPGVHELELDGARAVRIVLGAWYEQGSVLVWDRGRYELRTLPR